MRFAAATAVVRSAANARSSQRAPVGTVSELSAPAAGVVPAIDRSAPGREHARADRDDHARERVVRRDARIVIRAEVLQRRRGEARLKQRRRITRRHHPTSSHSRTTYCGALYWSPACIPAVIVLMVCPPSRRAATGMLMASHVDDPCPTADTACPQVNVHTTELPNV